MIKIITRLREDKMDFLSESALYYIIDGCTDIITAEGRFHLECDSLIYVPAFTRYEWKNTQLLTMLVITIPLGISSELEGWNYKNIQCNSVCGDDKNYSAIKKLCTDLLYEYVLHDNTLTARKKGIYYLILDVLMQEFSVMSSSSATISTDNERINRVLEYMHAHYSDKLTLESIGKKIYMSPSVFSRFFKKSTGYQFSDYCLKIRLNYASDYLKNTSMHVVDIAHSCGFSSATAFNKCFKKSFGMTPLEYRSFIVNENCKCDEEGLVGNNSEVIQKFIENYMDNTESGILRRKVIVNTQTKKVLNRAWGNAVNVGAAAELLSGTTQKHILALRQLIHYEYIRILNIFSSELRLRKNTADHCLNFDLLDNILDFFVENKINGIIDMGNRRKSIVKTTKKRVYELKEQEIFDSIADAEFVIERFLEHIIYRYGMAVVEKWIFEINYDEMDYGQVPGYTYEMYCFMVVPLIKKKIPKASVGFCIDIMNKIQPEVIQLCKTLPIPPEFVSVCALPYRQVDLPSGQKMAQKCMDPKYLKNIMLKLRKALDEQGTPDVKIYATEWNLNISDRNCVNDSQEFASQLLEMIARLLENVDLAVYTFASDASLRYYETGMPFFGGKGLISKDGLIKPSCYALSLFNRIENSIVQVGNSYIVTAGDNNRYCILCYNAKAFKYQYYQQDESLVYIDDLDHMFSDDEKLELFFHLTHIKNGLYTARYYSLTKNNSILYQWNLLGRNENLTLEERDYLNKICVPRIHNKIYKVTNGEMDISSVLEPHEICLIEIYRNN